jgi:hypothetical protein
MALVTVLGTSSPSIVFREQRSQCGEELCWSERLGEGAIDSEAQAPESINEPRPGQVKERQVTRRQPLHFGAFVKPSEARQVADEDNGE